VRSLRLIVEAEKATAEEKSRQAQGATARAEEAARRAEAGRGFAEVADEARKPAA